MKVTMDKKAKVILNHYKNKLENQLFDEYDILGFLIFIRNYFKNPSSFETIKDFAHLIAHRMRDKGIVMNAITILIDNKKKIEQEAKVIKNYKVEGYNGIQYDEWEKEWFTLGEKLNIKFNSEIINEITICVFSISQFTEYKSKNGKYFGKIEMIKSENAISLITNEGNDKALSVVFFNLLIDTSIRIENEKFYPVDIPVEAIRINGKLRLREVKI
jgi:hypothetical protein